MPGGGAPVTGIVPGSEQEQPSTPSSPSTSGTSVPGGGSLASFLQSALQNPGHAPEAPLSADDLTKAIAGLTAGQLYGSSASTLAQQWAKAIQGMPQAEAAKLIASIPTTGNLSQDVQSDVSGLPASGTPSSPVAQGADGSYDPLALQSMFSTVFQPYLSALNQQNAGTTGQYLQTMNSALANDDLTAEQKKALAPQINQMGAILGLNAQTAAAGAVAGPAYDNLIAQLQQSASAAALAKSEGERAVAYGTNQDFSSILGNNSTSGGASAPSGQSGQSGQYSMDQIQSLINASANAAANTIPVSSTTGLLPSQTIGVNPNNANANSVALAGGGV